MPKLKHKDKTAPRTHRDPSAFPDFTPGASCELLLDILWDVAYATPEILTLLYEHERGRGRYAIRNLLPPLYHHRYVERFYRPDRPSGHGSSQYIYTLAAKGARLVVGDEDFEEKYRHRVNNRLKKKTGQHSHQHSLLISTLQTILTVGTGDGPKLIDWWRDQEEQDVKVKVGA